MIAQRFRPLGWVAGIAAAACMLYMISLQVASERGRLEEIDRKIAAAKRDIRQLQTELGTRASLRQLERWNGEVLALSAPAAGQFLPDDAALAAIDRNQLGEASAAPPPAMMAVMTAPAEAPATPEPTLLARLTKPAPPPKSLTKADKQVQAAIAAKPAAKPQRVALLDGATISDLSSAARGESRAKSRP
jgi:hypothetical protein